MAFLKNAMQAIWAPRDFVAAYLDILAYSYINFK